MPSATRSAPSAPCSRYPDLTVQHAGIVVGMSWGAAHVHQGLPFGQPGYMLMTELDPQLHAPSRERA